MLIFYINYFIDNGLVIQPKKWSIPNLKDISLKKLKQRQNENYIKHLIKSIVV